MPQGAKRARAESDGERYRREVAERIFLAFDAYNAGVPKSGRITQADLGRLVAERRGLDRPIPQGTVSSWMSETAPSLPDNPTLAAIAEVLNANFSWLALGAATE